jgi:hypothetical protein
MESMYYVENRETLGGKGLQRLYGKNKKCPAFNFRLLYSFFAKMKSRLPKKINKNIFIIFIVFVDVVKKLK